MSRRFLFPLLLLAAVLPFVDSLVAQPPARKPRKVALLVGPREYLFDFSQLPHLDDDVTALAVELKKGGFDEVVVLTGKPEDANPATKKNILAELDRLLSGDGDGVKAIRKDDVVLLALSGHGQEAFVDRDKKDTFFAPIDGKKREPKTLVNVSEVLDKLGGCGCRTLILADMCRDIYDPNKGKGVDTDNLKLPKNAAILFGCESTQQSFVNTELKHSLFTYAVLEVLRESNKAGQPLLWSQLVSGVELKFGSDEFKTYMGTDRQQSPVERKTDLKTTTLVAAIAPPRPKPVVPKGDPQPGEEREFAIADGVKMTFCWIPKGKAILGSPETEKDRSKNEVEHPYEEKAGFWLGKYEVTQKQWASVIGENPSYFSATGGGKEKVAGNDTGDFPVEQVSFDDIYGKGWKEGEAPLASSFLALVKGRAGGTATFGKGGLLVLPHEERWEYAYRGGKGNKTPFYWGEALNGDKANSDAENPYGSEITFKNLDRSTRVGNYEKLAPHPWGLCDMSGNVSEWCIRQEEQEKNMSTSILRGGNYRGGSHGLRKCSACRGAFREQHRRSCHHPYIGFRVCVVFD